MCCVIPPASPAVTSVSRIASSSDVLPWSTWPMITTTGGRATRSLLVVVGDLDSVVLVGRMDDLDPLVELVGEHADRLVGQRLGDHHHLAHAHQLLDDLGDADAEVLAEVLDRGAGADLDDVRPRVDVDVDRRRDLFEDLAATTAAATRRTAHRTAGPPPGPPPGPPGPPGPRRAACESITTRRRPAPSPAPGRAPRPCSIRATAACCPGRRR